MQAQKQTQPNNELSFARADKSTLVVRLAGDWHLRHGLPSASLVEKELDTAPKPTKLTFDATDLRDWDSGLLTFLIGISELCHKRKLPADWSPAPRRRAQPDPAGGSGAGKNRRARRSVA